MYKRQLKTGSADKPAYALVNSKGFGGNNATAAVLGPDATHNLLARHHGDSAVSAWQHSHDRVQQSRADIEAQRLTSEWAPQYRFDDGVMANADVQLNGEEIVLGDRRIGLHSDLPDGWKP